MLGVSTRTLLINLKITIMNLEIKPRYWAVMIDGIEQSFIPLKFAKNEKEAIEYFKNNVLNKWQKERYNKFDYEAKPVASYVC